MLYRRAPPTHSLCTRFKSDPNQDKGDSIFVRLGGRESFVILEYGGIFLADWTNNRKLQPTDASTVKESNTDHQTPTVHINMTVHHMYTGYVNKVT